MRGRAAHACIQCARSSGAVSPANALRHLCARCGLRRRPAFRAPHLSSRSRVTCHPSLLFLCRRPSLSTTPPSLSASFARTTSPPLFPSLHPSLSSFLYSPTHAAARRDADALGAVSRHAPQSRPRGEGASRDSGLGYQGLSDIAASGRLDSPHPARAITRTGSCGGLFLRGACRSPVHPSHSPHRLSQAHSALQTPPCPALAASRLSSLFALLLPHSPSHLTACFHTSFSCSCSTRPLLLLPPRTPRPLPSPLASPTLFRPIAPPQPAGRKSWSQQRPHQVRHPVRACPASLLIRRAARRLADMR